MHVTRADQPDQLLIALAPQREHKKYPAAIASLSHRAKAAFLSPISGAGNDGKRPGEQAFNQCNGKPVLLTLGSVPSIPIKAMELQGHDKALVLKCIGKCKYLTSAANPPAPSHRVRENTWPARDTSAPRPHTSRRPRCGRKRGRPAWYAVRRCRRPRRSPS